MTGVRLLHDGAGTRELAILRIVVFLLWAGTILTTPLRQLARLPAELVQPRGVLRLVPAEAIAGNATMLLLVQALALAGCVACILGVGPYRVIALSTTALLVLHEGLVSSAAGFLVHSRLSLVVVTLIVALAPSAETLAVRPSGVSQGGLPPPAQWLRIASLYVLVTYSLVAARRLAGGAEVFTNGSLERWMVARSLQPAETGFDLGLLLLDHAVLPTLLPVAFLGTTLLELGAPLVMRSTPFRHVWTASILGFHVVVAVTMNLDFVVQSVLVLTLFQLLPLATARTRDAPPRSPGRTVGRSVTPI
jgi:hypothetical protein